jgi:glycogen operon protein
VWNCGAEGPTDDPEINALRKRQQRNMLATLFLSQGVPMLLGGDELGRTQQGNNNAYCQDNELSWIDWASADRELLAFTRRLAELRSNHRAFRRRGWFQGKPIRHAKVGASLPDVAWFDRDGAEMADEQWDAGTSRTVQVFLNGAAIGVTDERGEPIIDDTFLIVFHGDPEPRAIKLPAGPWGAKWRRVMDTEHGFASDGEAAVDAGAEVKLAGRSLWLFRREAER